MGPQPGSAQGFPFGMDDDDFPGMGGGFPGRGPPKEVDNEGLYKVLGVEKDA